MQSAYPIAVDSMLIQSVKREGASVLKTLSFTWTTRSIGKQGDSELDADNVVRNAPHNAANFF